MSKEAIQNPLTTRGSRLTVSEAADKLCAVLEAKGIRVFSRIDHAEAAAHADLTLGQTQVIVFGDPKVGTLLMQECPAVGYELPLRIVIWDEAGTQIGYRDPLQLLREYPLEKHREIVEKMSKLMAALLTEIENSGAE